MLEVVVDRDVWRLNFELLPPQPSRTWADSKRRKSQVYFNSTFKMCKRKAETTKDNSVI